MVEVGEARVRCNQGHGAWGRESERVVVGVRACEASTRRTFSSTEAGGVGFSTMGAGEPEWKSKKAQGKEWTRQSVVLWYLRSIDGSRRRRVWTRKRRPKKGKRE